MERNWRSTGKILATALEAGRRRSEWSEAAAARVVRGGGGGVGKPYRYEKSEDAGLVRTRGWGDR
jgi:hypothetical protein